MNEPLTLHPIGVTHCAFASRKGFPIGGCDATVEIFEPYREALDRLEASSHLLVLGFLHHADRSVLRARPRKVDARAAERGVLATRSPDRPNPVSVTIVPFLGREGRNLRVGRLDLLDGTPVIDVKPYCPGWDAVYSARHELRSRPDALDDPALIEILERDLENHLGPAATSHAARVVLAAGFLASRHLQRDLRDADLRVGVNRCDGALDALMGLTGAAFHDGRLALDAPGDALRLRFEAGGRRLALTERPGAGAAVARPERWPVDVFTRDPDETERS
jgi:tRNA-Thr(GGU) m(6)t(6)A37 methyltransferase TsaA